MFVMTFDGFNQVLLIFNFLGKNIELRHRLSCKRRYMDHGVHGVIHASSPDAERVV